MKNDWDRREIYFDEIFENMKQIYGLDDEQCSRLKEWELEAELDNVLQRLNKLLFIFIKFTSPDKPCPYPQFPRLCLIRINIIAAVDPFPIFIEPHAVIHSKKELSCRFLDTIFTRNIKRDFPKSNICL